ncbi:hypothetical protein ACHHV8_35240 [Paenibacillus sp. TAB 01]|uniref:hypothetical protein n=1 Tax=Paenibacillus sp. TAB 01 TaxID=3368988 RepID=UPI00375068EE
MDANKNIVKSWLEDKFITWLRNQNNSVSLAVQEHSDDLNITFTLLETDFDIVLSKEEIEEIALINSEIHRNSQMEVNGELLRSVYAYEEKTIFCPLVSDSREIQLEANKQVLTFICDKDSVHKVSAKITSQLSLRMLVILVQNNFKLKFVPMNEEHDTYKTDLASCFSEFNCIVTDLTNYIKPDPSDAEKIQVLLNVIYQYNLLLSVLVIPKGLVSNSGLRFFKILTQGEVTTEVIELPLYHYDLESLIYYLASGSHDDFRFEYLDLYHVLEYYFERAALYSIHSSLKKGLNNPALFFEDSEIHKLSRDIKEIIIVDRKKYAEEHSLVLILKLIGLERILQLVGVRNETGIELVIPQVKSGNVERLPKISIEFALSSKKCKVNNQDSSEERILEKLGERVYKIRNAIAHSKEEFDWRLKPNSPEISELEKIDLTLMLIISKEIIQLFRR